MLAVKNWQLLSLDEKKLCLSRPAPIANQRVVVNQIIEQVKLFGDNALLEFSQKFDGITLKTLQVSEEKIKAARIKPEALVAMQNAIATITQYQQSQLPESKTLSTAPGIRITTVYRPIQRVGLYTAGGNKTPLISSLLMIAIPAQIAGCPIKVLCTPPDPSGEINPNLLVAARLCGIETIYTVGGAQAIAAMAYGTETIPKVDKLFGPGNSYVNEAKTIVSCDPQGAAIDLPAGPSEVMVVADEQADPAFIAADLLAQAEHGVDSQVILLCNSEGMADLVNQEIGKQMQNLSRKNCIEKSLLISRIIVCPDRTEQIAIINNYAPEHLIINCIDAANWVDKINAVGTIFLGAWAAEAMGDYVTGSSHVLPTNGYAKNCSGLSTLDYLTCFNVQTIDKEGLRALGPSAITLAQLEGLDAHAQAVQLRLNTMEN